MSAAKIQRTGLAPAWWLIGPALLLFAMFFVAPLVSLFSISVNPPSAGAIRFVFDFTPRNFVRFFTNDLYYGAALASVWIALAVVVIDVAMGYPLAYVIAETRNPTRNAIFMIFLLGAMQLDIMIRMYGMMVLLGDNGLINQALIATGIVRQRVPLMYNEFGVIAGLVQGTLPFMVLPLIGVIRGIDPSLKEAARSLGAGRRTAFRRVILPLSLPGVVAGSVLVFGISVSSYAVPSTLGGNRVFTMPIHMYQQIMYSGAWQFGAAIAVILFAISMITVQIYNRALTRRAASPA